MSLHYLLNALRPAAAKVPAGQLIVHPTPHGPATPHLGYAHHFQRPTQHDKGWLPPRAR